MRKNRIKKLLFYISSSFVKLIFYLRYDIINFIKEVGKKVDAVK